MLPIFDVDVYIGRTLMKTHKQHACIIYIYNAHNLDRNVLMTEVGAL